MIARITLILAVLLSTTGVSSCRCHAASDGPLREATHGQQSCPNCGVSSEQPERHPGHVDHCCCIDILGTLPNDARRTLSVGSCLTPADLPRSPAVDVEAAAEANLAASPANEPPLLGGRALLLRTQRLLI